MDFYKDWIAILKHWLIENDFQPSNDPEKISIQFFNLQKRLVAPIPRKIYFSKEFNCPLEYRSGLESLIKKIENGEEITLNLSRKLKDLEYNDPMLNDWGIHHVHLGIDFNHKIGMMSRTKPILLVRFIDDKAFFIAVKNHGRGVKKQPWTMQEIIRIIYNNWPELLEQHQLSGITGRDLSDEEVAQSRRGGYNLGIHVNQKVFMPLGLGYTASGKSFESIYKTDYYKIHITDCEKYIAANINEIKKELHKKNIEIGKNLNFKLMVDQESGTFYAKEVNSNLLIELKGLK